MGLTCLRRQYMCIQYTHQRKLLTDVAWPRHKMFIQAVTQRLGFISNQYLSHVIRN